ncbi:Zn2/Cys6 DNA-binding protein [Fonsecaea pedrosoi]|nr:Zn2/Cys6 DNA-binding protein [Fonsecaea pedrosoi]
MFSTALHPASPQFQELPAPLTAPTRLRRPRTRRSCDFCRSRKSACRLDQGPPCYACRLYARECVISERPPRKRQKSTSEAGKATAGPVAAHDKGAARSVHTDIPRASNWTQGAQAAASASNDVDLAIFSPQSNGSSQQMSPTQGAGSVTSQVSIESGRPTTRHNVVGREYDTLTESLDAWPTKTTFLLGDTGESDPYLLRHFSTECLDSSVDDIAKVTPRHMLRASDPDVMHSQGKPLIMSIADHSLYDRGEPRLDQSVLDQAADEVAQMVSDETGVRLVKLFFRYIYPYFPILSKSRLLYPLVELPSRLKQLPLSLKAAIYASALAFFTYDDVLATTIVHSPPSSQRLYRIAWVAVTHEVHTPHLSTLQSCLLLLQRVNDDRYVMDTVFRWSLLGWTVALAQTFGLSTDCLDWTGLPDWEKRLRRRLWWATFVMDKWAFMSAGLSSHIHDDSYDVSPLNAADFISSGETESSQQQQNNGNIEAAGSTATAEPPLSHFYHLTRLTAILSDIQTAFFTIAASKRTERDFKLSIELAKPIRRRLKEWKTSYDAYLDTTHLHGHHNHHNATSMRSRSSGLDGNASLGLSYLVTNIMLFRALLRPLESNLPSTSVPSSSSEAGHDAVRIGAKTCCIEAVEFVESLRRNVWDAFWHSWSRAGFAMISSMMIRLLITSEDPGEVDDINALIRRWRWALRTGGGSAGNVLMSLALLRLDRSLVTRGIHESDEE